MSRRVPIALLTALLLAPASRLPAQTVEVSAEQENLRLEPTGKRLATVNGGTRVAVEGSQGRWRLVTLEGWIWSPSVSAADRQGHDLVVSADGGENLREEPDPDARVAARLLEGFLLRKTGERGRWTRVRRTAWRWAPSLSEVGDGEGSSGGDGEGGDPPGPAPGGPDRLVVEDRPASLFVSPGGDTLATARPGADLSVLAREGEWARVRMEAWVRVAELARSDSASASDLGIEAVTANPDQYRGRRVRWSLQFISLERAEPERTDFYEGEPFILARPTDGSGGFVYVAVPPERVSRVQTLTPLQRIRVTGRLRTGRSSVMGAPVLELIELVPAGRGPRGTGE